MKKCTECRRMHVPHNFLCMLKIHYLNSWADWYYSLATYTKDTKEVHDKAVVYIAYLTRMTNLNLFYRLYDSN